MPPRLMALVTVPAVLIKLSRFVVVPAAPLRVIARPLVWVPDVLVRLSAMPSAVCDWLKMAAGALMPLVALTVSPTTLAAVGVTVLAAVVAGTCCK